MTAEQFNEAYALCSFLPGANIVNFSVIFGAALPRAARRPGRDGRADGAARCF